MKGEVVVMAVLLLLTTLAASNVPTGQTILTERIVIRADGSVSPSYAPIQRNGDVYTLTDDITCTDIWSEIGCIAVERDSVVIDGAGYTVDVGQDVLFTPGIYLSGRTNVTIKNMKIRDCSAGLRLVSSKNNIISGNSITSNGCGIWLKESSSNTFYHNNFINNTMQVYDFGLDNWDYDISINIWDNGYPSGGNYWGFSYIDQFSGPNQDQPGSDGIGDWPYTVGINNQDNYPLISPLLIAQGPIYVSSDFTFSSNITFTSNGLIVTQDNIVIDGAGYWLIGAGTFGSIGICLSNRSNVIIRNVRIKAFDYGIYLNCSSYNTVFGCNMRENWVGIAVMNSSKYNTIGENNVEANTRYGIYLFTSSNNRVISNNSTANTRDGIVFDNSPVNFMSENSLTKNGRYGLTLIQSSNNCIYHNNFNNTVQVYDLSWTNPSYAPSVNIWDNGYPSGGNYWSDYQPTLLCYDDGSGETEIAFTGTGEMVAVRFSSSMPGIITNCSFYARDIFYDPWSWDDYIFVKVHVLNANMQDMVTPFYVMIQDASWYNVNLTGYGIMANTDFYIAIEGYSRLRIYADTSSPDGRSWYFNGASWIQWTGGDYLIRVTTGGGMDDNGDGIGDTPYIIDTNNQDQYPLMKAWTQLPEVLYGSGAYPIGLFTINTRTGAGSLVGPFGTQFSVWGLDYDSKRDILYGVTNDAVDVEGNGQLLKINRTTGTATPIGGLIGRRVDSLAYDSMNDKLYGVDNQRNLVAIDTSTGLGTLIGSTGFPNLQGLTFNVADGKLYSVETGLGALVRIETLTGVGTAIASIDSTMSGIRGLSFDRSGKLYGVWLNQTTWISRLVTINIATGQVTDIGSTGYGMEGLVFAPGSARDLAVTNITVDRNRVTRGYSANIYVTVTNQGTQAETFVMLAYANDSIVQGWAVSLPSSSWTTIAVTWDTTNFALGNYTISANVATLEGEIDTADNTLINGSVVVVVQGDINADGSVDIYDAIILAGAYNSSPGNPNWNPYADLNADLFVDIFDAIILAGNYGRTA